MDAKTNIKARLPRRHVTEGPAGDGSTNAALHLPASPHECRIGLTRFDVEVFKRTPYVPDLKPGGRYVAKDIFEVGGTPLLMKTLLDHGYLHGECITVRGRTSAETMKSVKWNPDRDVVRPADRPTTATGGAHETQYYADA
jgi:dihydroxy-acid dehydratase